MIEGTPSSRISILLVEDHQVVREGIRSLLVGEPDFEVVGEASDGTQAVTMAEEKSPQVIVMDISLRGMDGIEATKRVLKSRPQTHVIFLTMHDDAATVDRALRPAARRYALKGSGANSLVAAIRSVSRGEAFLSPDVSHYVLRGYLREEEEEVDPLSERERQVLALIAAGFTGREIAEKLGLKPKTVENHRARIMEKLDIHTTAGLVRYALQKNLAS